MARSDRRKMERAGRKRGDLNRKSQHRMRSKMGMRETAVQPVVRVNTLARPKRGFLYALRALWRRFRHG